MNYTAAHYAAKLGCTERGLRKALERAGVASDGTVIVRGKPTAAWAQDRLPDPILEALRAMAFRRGFRTVTDYLVEAALPYTPARAFGGLPERFQSEAQSWCSALASPLARQHEMPPGELLALGLSECRRVFGREISESTWRRHFDLAVQRDAGAAQWARLDLYVAPEAYAAQAPQPAHAEPTSPAPPELVALNDSFRQIANPCRLTGEEKQIVFSKLLPLAGRVPASALLDFTFSALPGLARTPRALRRLFQRKLKAWNESGSDVSTLADRRADHSGRKAKRLCPDCRHQVLSAAVSLDGNLPMAFRRLILPPELGGVRQDGKGFCAKCAGLWQYDVRKEKSYVPASVRADVWPDIDSALVHRRGPQAARVARPKGLSDHNDYGPGCISEMDDVTWNHVGWGTNSDGSFWVGRPESLHTMDRRTDYPLSFIMVLGEELHDEITGESKRRRATYTALDIMVAIRHNHNEHGFPHDEYLLENGIWGARLLNGAPLKEWEFRPWGRVELSFAERVANYGGMHFGPLKVSHALAQTPWAKMIEGMFGRVQERMRCEPGFVGFNHREWKPEKLNDFLQRVKAGKEHPGNEVPSVEQLRKMVEENLRQYAAEPQNGDRLPGVSPKEAFENGIGTDPATGKPWPGVGRRPLRKLTESDRWILSSYEREFTVDGGQIRFALGRRSFVFFGELLARLNRRKVRAFINLETPEVLTLLHPDTGEPFTMKNQHLPSRTATPEQLAQRAKDAAAVTRHGRHVFSQLKPDVLCTIERSALSPEVKRIGAAMESGASDHREKQSEQRRVEKRAQALAGALGRQITIAPGQARRQAEGLEWEREILAGKEIKP